MLICMFFNVAVGACRLCVCVYSLSYRENNKKEIPKTTSYNLLYVCVCLCVCEYHRALVNVLNSRHLYHEV
jgi:hypothetical protein